MLWILARVAIAWMVGVIVGLASRAVATAMGWSGGGQSRGGRRLETAVIIVPCCY